MGPGTGRNKQEEIGISCLGVAEEPSPVMTTSAAVEPTQHLVQLDTPFTDQKPGTSGLRKSSQQFEQPHYLESFVEAVFRTLPGVQGGTPGPGGAMVVTATVAPSTVILRMGSSPWPQQSDRGHRRNPLHSGRL